MYPFSAFLGVKIPARTADFDAFPVLGAHICGAKFQHPDLIWKEPTGIMANLMGDSGYNKGQLSHLVEAICCDFRQHDDVELKEQRDGAGGNQFIIRVSFL